VIGASGTIRNPTPSTVPLIICHEPVASTTSAALGDGLGLFGTAPPPQPASAANSAMAARILGRLAMVG
jgi:hypothetical protein